MLLGHELDFGDREFRIRQAFERLLAAVEATSDGSLYDVDPESVDELPERGTPSRCRAQLPSAPFDPES